MEYQDDILVTPPGPQGQIWSTWGIFLIMQQQSHIKFFTMFNVSVGLKLAAT